MGKTSPAGSYINFFTASENSSLTGNLSYQPYYGTVCGCRLVFGTLYPAYSSYKAVKTKDVKEYVSILFHFLGTYICCIGSTEISLSHI